MERKGKSLFAGFSYFNFLTGSGAYGPSPAGRSGAS
jgi:hypothetical protein